MHRYLLRRSQSNLPGFFEFEGVHFELCRLFASSKLRLLSAAVSLSEPLLRGLRTCLAESDFEEEKPGGSGMLDAFFALGGGPLLSSTTHLGGGGVDIAREVFYIDADVVRDL